MSISEEPLSTTERGEIDQFSAEGLRALHLDDNAEPRSVVTALGEYVDNKRVGIGETSEDEYAWLVLSMAYLWGDQVCRAYGWEWVKLVYDGGESKAIVSPDRAFAVYPLFFVKGIIDDPERDSTIILLFNMLEEQWLTRDFPQRQAAQYMRLT